MNVIEAISQEIDRQTLDFSIVGLATNSGLIYPIGTDTKVLSTGFELVVRQIVLRVANKYGLKVYEPSQQNFYPDFTLMKDASDSSKIAIDVKTTYRNFVSGSNWNAKYTLGSYTSFLRKETKNIAFPYSQYSKHFVLGFLYTRLDGTKDVSPFDSTRLREIDSPISEVEWFMQEKYRIASDTPGSGNTTNIGSISGKSLDDFRGGNGPFSKLGESVFEEYWRNYSSNRTGRAYSNLTEFLAIRN